MAVAGTLGLLPVLGLGLAHVLARYRPAPRLAGVLKPLPILLLAAAVLWAASPESVAYRRLVVAALLCSAVGDVSLLWPGGFLPGLSSFLVAHLFYVAAFASAPASATRVLAVPFVVFAAGMLAYLWPHLGKLRAPVVVYVAVLTAMGWQAAVRAGAVAAPSGALALAGAMLFMLSDALLAIDRFARPFHLGDAAVMATYYAAQTLIAESALV